MTELESNLNQVSTLLDNTKKSLEDMGTYLYQANMDYLAERKEAERQIFRNKVLTVTICVAIPVSIGLGIWAGIEISRAAK